MLKINYKDEIEQDILRVLKGKDSVEEAVNSIVSLISSLESEVRKEERRNFFNFMDFQMGKLDEVLNKKDGVVHPYFRPLLQDWKGMYMEYLSPQKDEELKYVGAPLIPGDPNVKKLHLLSEKDKDDSMKYWTDTNFRDQR